MGRRIAVGTLIALLLLIGTPFLIAGRRPMFHIRRDALPWKWWTIPPLMDRQHTYLFLDPYLNLLCVVETSPDTPLTTKWAKATAEDAVLLPGHPCEVKITRARDRLIIFRRNGASRVFAVPPGFVSLLDFGTTSNVFDLLAHAYSGPDDLRGWLRATSPGPP